jgi:Caspase domain
VSWAIVIGIDDYRGGAPTLQAAAYDAQRFSRWLIDSVGLRERRVKLLLGRRPKDPDRDGSELVPTKDNLLTAINEVMAESHGAGEALYFFFGGHGVTAKHANRAESALVFPGIDKHHPVQTLAVRSITEFFETTRFLDQFFFIDACRSPLETRDAEIGAWQIPRRREPGQDPPQQFILYATSPERTAKDAVWPREHSAFSKVLMDGLRGQGAAKAWSWERSSYEVRWERLATYVKTQMEGKRTKRSGEVRYPFQIPQDVGIRGVAGRERDALLSRPRAGEVAPAKLTLDLGGESAQVANVTVVDAIGVPVATAVGVTGTQEFTLPPRTYGAKVETADGRVGRLVPPIELYTESSPEIVWLEEDEPEPDDRYMPGTISIRSPDPFAVADVRDETGRVVGVATQTDGCRASPGFYRVRLVGPERDKASVEDLVLLRSGKTVSAALTEPAVDEHAAGLAYAFGGSSGGGYVKPTAKARPAAWAQPSTVVTAGIGAALQGDRAALDALGLGEAPALGEKGSAVGFFAVPGTGNTRSLKNLQVRLWAAGRDVPEDAHALEPTNAGVASVVEVAAVPEPYWLSIEAPNTEPTVVALPLLQGRLAALVGQVDSDRVRLYQYHPLARPVEPSMPNRLRRLEHLQRQLLGGRLDGAKGIVVGGRPDAEDETVERLRALGLNDPFGGCLAGYVLLRLGLREGLGELASAVVEAAPQLSDAYILRAEYEAYRQNDEAMNQAFADAVSVGIPAFGEGLTRLVEGLRASGFVHPRGALVRYIFQRHARGSMWAAFTPRYEFKPGRLVITGADIGYEA